VWPFKAGEALLPRPFSFSGRVSVLIVQAAEWLEATWLSTAIRESIWVYPIVESLHVLAIAPFLGLTETPIDDWNNQTFVANVDGAPANAPPLIEAYERICVEGNEGHGNPASPSQP
jgi:hypothetical protein